MSETHHASCVAFGAVGVLIIGKSGSGKSSLALSLIGLGGTLVADDRTILTAVDEQLIASCPASITGKIEARGFGILTTEPTQRCIVRLVVDMDQSEPERLPPQRLITVSGIEVETIYGKDTYNLPIATKLILNGARVYE
jgi:HPr kinase/phosphorylase